MLRDAAKDTMTGKAVDWLTNPGADDEDGTEGNDDGEDEDVVETGCGVDPTLPQPEEVMDAPPDGGRGWFIVIAALVILPIVSVYESLLASVLIGFQEEYDVMKGIVDDYTLQKCKELPTYYYLWDPIECLDPEVIEKLAAREETLQEINRIQDVFDETYSLFGIFSAMSIVAFGYRLVAVVGASINILSLLISAFVRDYKALAFLSGFCVGAGNNMLYLSGLVAVMEYFSHRRTLALSLQSISMALGNLAVLLMYNSVFPKVNLTSSKGLLIYTCVSYVPCLVAAATLTPLNLHMKEKEQTFKGRVLSIEGFRILKSPFLYVLMAIFLCYKYGQKIPFLTFDLVYEPFRDLLNFCLLYASKFFGSFVASLFSCTCSCCKASKCCRCCLKVISVQSATIILTLIMSLMAAVHLARKGFIHSDILEVYNIMFGFCTGIAEPVLTALVPLAFGDKYLGIIMGLADLGTGLGKILSREISVAAVNGTGNPDVRFYIGSAFLLLAAILTIVLFIGSRKRSLVMDEPKREDVSEAHEGDEYAHRSDSGSINVNQSACGNADTTGGMLEFMNSCVDEYHGKLNSTPQGNRDSEEIVKNSDSSGRIVDETGEKSEMSVNGDMVGAGGIWDHPFVLNNLTGNDRIYDHSTATRDKGAGSEEPVEEVVRVAQKDETCLTQSVKEDTIEGDKAVWTTNL